MARHSARLVFAFIVVWGAAGAAAGGRLGQSASKPEGPGDGAQPAPAAGRRSQAAASPAGDAARGKALYEKYGCWACHGYAGQGGAGRRLAPSPIPLPIFTRLVRRPPNQMPPYTEKVVGDGELADIHAYLGTIPAPPDASAIPLLQGRQR